MVGTEVPKLPTLLLLHLQCDSKTNEVEEEWSRRKHFGTRAPFVSSEIINIRFDPQPPPHPAPHTAHHSALLLWVMGGPVMGRLRPPNIHSTAATIENVVKSYATTGHLVQSAYKPL